MPSEPMKLIILDTFNPSATTSRTRSATLDTLFISGCQWAASSDQCALMSRPIASGMSISTINDLAMSHGLTDTPGSSRGRTMGR